MISNTCLKWRYIDLHDPEGNSKFEPSALLFDAKTISWTIEIINTFICSYWWQWPTPVDTGLKLNVYIRCSEEVQHLSLTSFLCFIYYLSRGVQVSKMLKMKKPEENVNGIQIWLQLINW